MLLIVFIGVIIIGYFIWQNNESAREDKLKADKAASDLREMEAEANARAYAELTAEIDRQKTMPREHFNWSSIKQFDLANADQISAARSVIAVCQGIQEYLKIPGVDASEISDLKVTFPAAGPAKYDYTKTVVFYKGQIVAEEYHGNFYMFRPGRWIDIVWEIEPKVAAVRALKKQKSEVDAKAQKAAHFDRVD